MIFRSRVQRMFPAVVVACLAGLSWLDVPVMGQAYQKSEDFSTDPGWDDFGNRTPPQNFGYTATNYTVALSVRQGVLYSARRRPFTPPMWEHSIRPTRRSQGPVQVYSKAPMNIRTGTS